MKKTSVIIALIIIVIFAIGIAKDQIIRSVITIVATEVTGAPVHIDGFSLGVFNQSVRITGFKMYNPRGFSRGILIDLPKIVVNYDVPSILKRKLHLLRAEIQLKEIGLEKNKEGKLNVDSLKMVQQNQPKEAQEKKPGKPLPMQIDLLNLEIGRIVSKDYSVGEEPAIQVYDINLRKSYKNINSAQQLAALILSEPMKQAGIKGEGIYGAALLTGVGVVPVAIIATFAGKDSVQQNFDVAIDKLYSISLEVVKGIGKVSKEDKAAGIIAAEVNGANIKVALKQVSAKATQVTISARKYMMPKPETASGVFYRIAERLK